MRSEGPAKPWKSAEFGIKVLLGVLAAALVLLSPVESADAVIFQEGPLLMLTDVSLCVRLTWRLNDASTGSCTIQWGTTTPLENSLTSMETNINKDTHRHTVDLCQLEAQ
eukprot:RCo052782